MHFFKGPETEVHLHVAKTSYSHCPNSNSDKSNRMAEIFGTDRVRWSNGGHSQMALWTNFMLLLCENQIFYHDCTVFGYSGTPWILSSATTALSVSSVPIMISVLNTSSNSLPYILWRLFHQIWTKQWIIKVLPSETGSGLKSSEIKEGRHCYIKSGISIPLSLACAV